jgi:hypothetical protein
VAYFTPHTTILGSPSIMPLVSFALFCIIKSKKFEFQKCSTLPDVENGDLDPHKMLKFDEI